MRALALLALLVAACSSDASDPSPDVDAGSDAQADLSIGGMCSNYQQWVTDAVRNLPRTCQTASDCMVVERAGNCECALAATVGGDLAALSTALDELDAHECRHPFTCAQAMSQCSYATPFEDTELIVACRESTCALEEVMACDTYVARKNGGIFPAGACETDADCELRDDLNPCGCMEAYPASFPFLVANAAYELIQRNQSRCGFTCTGCPAVAEAFCDAGKCAAR